MSQPSRRLLALAWLVVACGGGSQEGQGPPAAAASSPPVVNLDKDPPPRTEAVLVGPLCEGSACRCREGDDDAGQPPAGHKRFEVRLGVADDPMWVVVDGMILYKSRDRPESCFYVDLVPGKHAIGLRAVGDAEGMSAALAVGEQGGAEDATWWYRTFDFQCGTPEPCDVGTLEAWKREAAVMEGKHDPCGSTKVEQIRWETSRSPDRDRPDELILRFTLDVYKFTPANPPGSEECDKRSQGRGE